MSAGQGHHRQQQLPPHIAPQTAKTDRLDQHQRLQRHAERGEADHQRTQTPGDFLDQ